MRLLILIPMVLLLGCGRETTVTTHFGTLTNTTTTTTVEFPPVAAGSGETLPTWYVFKIKAIQKVMHNEDRSSALLEGVTIADKAFTVKLVWAEFFKNSHPKALDFWIGKSKEEFEAGVPYVIAGKVLSRDPLTIQPDTLAANAPNFGAPPENVY